MGKQILNVPLLHIPEEVIARETTPKAVTSAPKDQPQESGSSELTYNKVCINRSIKKLTYNIIKNLYS